MENQNDIQISIPKPCHEDWNKMTPNEKGAFCGKCAKTVVDFTKKTTEEIKDFLIAQSGKKICGRFMSEQLHDTTKKIDLYIPLNLLPRKLSFNRAFAFALFIVFGTSLFSCSTQQGEVVGKIAPVIDTTEMTITGDVKETRLTGDTIYNVIETQTVTGGVGIEKVCEPLKGDVEIEHMQGEISSPIDTASTPKDTLLKEEIKKGKIKIEE
jgi:hypothetical protein